jgi:hypothetical protein
VRIVGRLGFSDLQALTTSRSYIPSLASDPNIPLTSLSYIDIHPLGSPDICPPHRDVDVSIIQYRLRTIVRVAKTWPVNAAGAVTPQARCSIGSRSSERRSLGVLGSRVTGNLTTVMIHAIHAIFMSIGDGEV